MPWPCLVFFCLNIWWSSLQISIVLANVPTLPNYSKYSTVLETTHAIKTRPVSKSGFFLPRTKTMNFATVKSFPVLYNSKFSIISCWWITTPISLDLPSAFNWIVSNQFHHKQFWFDNSFSIIFLIFVPIKYFIVT